MFEVLLIKFEKGFHQRIWVSTLGKRFKNWFRGLKIKSLQLELGMEALFSMISWHSTAYVFRTLHYASNFLYNAPYFLPQHDKYSYNKVASGYSGIATNSINWLTFWKKTFLGRSSWFLLFWFSQIISNISTSVKAK